MLVNDLFYSLVLLLDDLIPGIRKKQAQKAETAWQLAYYCPELKLVAFGFSADFSRTTGEKLPPHLLPARQGTLFY